MGEPGYEQPQFDTGHTKFMRNAESIALITFSEEG